MFNQDNKEKVFLLCDYDNSAYSFIDKLAIKNKKKIIMANTNYDEKDLCNNNIVIFDNFDIGNMKKYDVKIIIIITLNDYQNKKKCDIDCIIMQSRLQFGYIQSIYNDYLKINCGRHNFIEFLNVCAQLTCEEYTLVFVNDSAFFYYDI